ncbi:TPR repeat-containing protein (plasmid) [Azospirillum sp. B510]|uniref:tetratricopeptide repeat protein n=1 Tax=Azospirillum sp. (strain B510) TaxID=137722 RepID=UPI0001C4B907|nr:tetratricopeptide repeat protein [Azospirillum sp. B510]BAI74181.1 TPR repeat-containing protein [Azospirillum sp. B510]
MTAVDLLDTALPLHQAGRFAEALALYRRILVDDPANADALHLSGMIAHQTGRTLEALSSLGAALALQPRFPSAYNSLGNVLADLGMLDEALAAYSVAIRQNDRYVEAYGNRATVLQRLGRREEAEEAYVRALTMNPDNLTARFNYGILQREMGRIAPAANAFYMVVKADPSHSTAWRHLAICLRGLGHPDAEACLRRALEGAPVDQELSLELGVLLNAQGDHGAACDILAPAVAAHGGDAKLRFAFGTALQAMGRLQAAAVQYRLALDREPLSQGACNNLGVALLELGAVAAAAPVLRRAMALSPDDALVVNNHGTSLEDRHDLESDLERPARWYRRALRLRPDYGKALINLAGIHIAKRETERGEFLYRRSAAADPGNVEVYANLAGLLLDRDDPAGALRMSRRALAIDAESPASLTGHGLVLQTLGRIDEAEAAHRRALAIDGRNAEAAGNLGLLLWQYRQDHEAAEPLMALALSINPALGTAHLNRGMLRLTLGDLAGGWEGYRWRFRAKGYVNRRIPVPLWRGEPSAALRLLVWREQGVGDEILFASCYPSLMRLANHVVIECDERLVPLFRRSFPQATVRAESFSATGDETILPSDIDAHVPAGDLPGLLRGSLSAFEPQGPWLVPDPALVARWGERLAALGPGLRVGIGWRSQMMTAERKAAYVMLEHWGPLFAVPGLVLVNLQYGDCEAELRAAEARFGVTIHRWADLNLKDDFDGAAALTSNLDLVISPAMSAGELAGALGVAVWRFGGRDWTQLGTGVRPWFPTMRLFQPNPGEGLETMLARMAKDLKKMGASNRSAPVSVPVASQEPAIDINRTMAEAVTLYRGGRMDEAASLVRQVLNMAPEHPVALHLAGVLAKRSGSLEEARALLVRAAAADPTNASAPAALCEVQQGLGQFDAAERASRACVVAQPDGAGHWVNRTALLRRMGHDGAARSAVTHALRLTPDLVPAHGHRAELAASPEDAVEGHRVAVCLAPGLAEIHSNLGAALHKTDRFAEAEHVLTRAIRCDPALAVAWTNRGNAVEALGRVAEAETCHRTAIGQNPSLADAHANLAHLLDRHGRAEEALAAFDAALEADPKHPQAHYNRSLLLLKTGVLRGGWTDHEWRFATPQFQGQRRRLAMRAWRGENIAGRRLLVWREQGVGDEILFASCYDEAMRRAGRLVIECDRRLVRLFARSFPTADVRPESADPRDADVQIAAGSLPRLLRADLKRFPERPSWLVPDPALVARWGERLAALGPGLRVGIGWRSQIMTAERRASYVMLEHWGPLFAVPGLVLVNLQYGDCEAELRAAEARFGVTIHRWTDLNLKDDFDGAAALTSNLDLVISPAMSAGELAGALGVAVWRFGSRDWTQLGTGTRPWFPTMRLFQPNPGQGLEATIGAMATELRVRTSPRGRGPRPVRSGDGETPDPEPEPATAPDMLLEQAVAAHRAGAADLAASLYERVLASRPRDPVALHLSGLLAHQSGAPERGEPRIAAAVAAAPDYGTAHVSLGTVRLTLGRADQAAVSFRTALALQPGNAAALTNLGNALETLDRSAAAARLHRLAIAADPDLAEAHDNLGVALARLGRWDEAERAHAQALRRAPALEAGWVNLSLVLRRLGRLGAAERAGRLALALSPALADGMANRGRLLREMGDDIAAALWCRRALVVEPGHAAAGFNGGILDLVAGRLARGWERYDRRFETRDLIAAARRPGVPLWDGRDLSGKRLLVWREQGIGDELMFAQRLPELIRRADGVAAHIVVECDPRFVPLFSRSFPGTTVRARPVSPDASCGDVDCHIAIGSLSRHLGTSLSAFAQVEPALRADPVAVAGWRRRLADLATGPGEGLRIGIAWRSGQLDPDRVSNYTRIEDWGPVLTLPGIIPVNLQYGECRAELAVASDLFGRAPHAFADLDLRDDLDGAAALMSALDLVIAPATSTGELAAGLGRPVWRLASAGDWTALGTGVRPWFPSMRLFRTRPGQTVGDLLPAVAAELVRLRKADG